MGGKEGDICIMQSLPDLQDARVSLKEKMEDTVQEKYLLFEAAKKLQKASSTYTTFITSIKCGTVVQKDPCM